MSNSTRLWDVSGVKFNLWTKHKKAGWGQRGGRWLAVAAVRPIHHKDISSLWGEGRSVSTGLSMETNEDEGNSWRCRASVIPPLSVYSRVPLPPLPPQTLPVINNLAINVRRRGQLCVFFNICLWCSTTGSLSLWAAFYLLRGESQ